MHLVSSKQSLQSYLVDELRALMLFNERGKRSEIIDKRIDGLQECLHILQSNEYNEDALAKIEEKFAGINPIKKFGGYRYGCMNCGGEFVTVAFIGQFVCRDCAKQLAKLFEEIDHG